MGLLKVKDAMVGPYPSPVAAARTINMLPALQISAVIMTKAVHVQPVTHMFITMEIIVALVTRRKSMLLKVKDAMVGPYPSPVAAARTINMLPALQISAVIMTKMIQKKAGDLLRVSLCLVCA